MGQPDAVADGREEAVAEVAAVEVRNANAEEQVVVEQFADRLQKWLAAQPDITKAEIVANYGSEVIFGFLIGQLPISLSYNITQ